MPRPLLPLLTLVLGLAVPPPCSGLDPGTATGTLSVDGEVVALTHSYAQQHDNAEGWLDAPREMRVLVADRELDPGVLLGLTPTVTLFRMVRAGLVRGVLLRFDPEKPKRVLATVLVPPRDPEALTNLTLPASETGPLESFVLSPVRVGASLAAKSGRAGDLAGEGAYRFSFSAPVFHEPEVTADIRGRKARQAPQTRVLLAKAAALMRGDLVKVRELSTDRGFRQMETTLSRAVPEAQRGLLQECGREIERAVGKGSLHLVVRGERATLIVTEREGRAMFGLALQGGKWVVD